MSALQALKSGLPATKFSRKGHPSVSTFKLSADEVRLPLVSYLPLVCQSPGACSRVMLAFAEKAVMVPISWHQAILRH